MHFANGREAKNGDKVVLFGYGGPMVGILYDAQAGNDYCYARIALTAPSDPCRYLKECLHLDDVLALFPADEHALAGTHPVFLRRVLLVPDTSEKTASVD